jgi:glycosyltransferase involved in cell wall biosynthesis
MKICQVISSNIPIKPTGERNWGALELIIDEYSKGFRNLGHEVDIKYLNELGIGEYDIVHIHVANLAVEASKRGLPYIYSTHDHHSFYYGKDSFNYKEQLQAIKGSIFSICHAEYVVDYFDGTDKLFFVPHGVDTNYYTNPFISRLGHKLLVCANNGLGGDYGFDRKGFKVSIESAKKLDLPITIVGADANKRFFEIHKELLEYEKLIVIDTNPTEDEKLKIFQDHTIFLHPSMLEYGHPNLTLLEAASCCLPIVGTYNGSNHFWGMWVIPEISTDAVVHGIKETIKTYEQRQSEMLSVRDTLDWSFVCENVARKYEDSLCTKHYNSDTIRLKYINSINKTLK